MKTTNIRIVAELANGHEGSIEQALLLLKAAASAGADAGKFQAIYADELSTPDYEYYDIFRGLEMPDSGWARIVREAEALDLALILDIFGERSLNLAENLGLREIMIHATDLTNMALIDAVAARKWDSLILGVGGAHQSEIEVAVNKLSQSSLVIMVGFQGYPTPDNENQVARVARLTEHFSSFPNLTVGFADHSLPNSPYVVPFSSMALGLGARVFEKHLTLGESMKLLDSDSALNPDKFADFSRGLRACVEAMGTLSREDHFGLYPAEERYRAMVRRKVVTTKNLSAGSIIRSGDVQLKRSGEIGDVFDINLVIDRVLRVDVKANHPLVSDDVQE